MGGTRGGIRDGAVGAAVEVTTGEEGMGREGRPARGGTGARGGNPDEDAGEAEDG